MLPTCPLHSCWLLWQADSPGSCWPPCEQPWPHRPCCQTQAWPGFLPILCHETASCWLPCCCLHLARRLVPAPIGGPPRCPQAWVTRQTAWLRRCRHRIAVQRICGYPEQALGSGAVKQVLRKGCGLNRATCAPPRFDQLEEVPERAGPAVPVPGLSEMRRTERNACVGCTQRGVLGFHAQHACSLQLPFWSPGWWLPASHTVRSSHP